MDNLLSFFQSKWTKFGFSFLSIAYGAFLAFLAGLTCLYYLIPINGTSLFVLYLFINVMFGVIMVYTRKQIITQITSIFLHPCILVMMIFSFNNWYLLIPVFVVSTIVFFAAASSESLKTVLGTIYLILFVIAYLGYLTIQQFSINIFNVNLESRSNDYLYSPNETYRLVKYIDEEEAENMTVNYYIEVSGEDLKLPFLNCERIYGAYRVLTARHDKEIEVRWLSDTKLLIDNKVKDIQMIEKNNGEVEEEDDFSGETIILTTAPVMTKVTTIESSEETNKPVD